MMTKVQEFFFFFYWLVESFSYSTSLFFIFAAVCQHPCLTFLLYVSSSIFTDHVKNRKKTSDGAFDLLKKYPQDSMKTNSLQLRSLSLMSRLKECERGRDNESKWERGSSKDRCVTPLSRSSDPCMASDKCFYHGWAEVSARVKLRVSWGNALSQRTSMAECKTFQ